MRILFDHNTPRGIAGHLAGHTVTKAKERGWDRLTNGDLLAAAEKAGFDLLLTADKNMAISRTCVGGPLLLLSLDNQRGRLSGHT
jgi:hypothetical protein